MQQKNFDYNALKLEYFQSEIDEIKGFWVAKGLKYNSKVGEHTRGRGQEKQKRKDEIVQKALEKEKNKLAKKLEIPVEFIFDIKKDALDLLRKKLDQIKTKIEIPPEDEEKANNTINVADLERIWKIAKTELWEPTNVVKNEGKTTLETNWPLVQVVRSDEKEETEEAEE